MRTLYLDVARARAPRRRRARSCQVSPLLRELILRVVAFRQPYAPRRAARRASSRCCSTSSRRRERAPLHLPMPRDPPPARDHDAPERGSRRQADARRLGARPPARARARWRGSSARDRPQLRALAPAGAPAARARAAGGGRVGDGGRVRPRLRQPERVHHHVSFATRRDAWPLLSRSSRGSQRDCSVPEPAALSIAGSPLVSGV